MKAVLPKWWKLLNAIWKVAKMSQAKKFNNKILSTFAATKLSNFIFFCFLIIFFRYKFKNFEKNALVSPIFFPDKFYWWFNLYLMPETKYRYGWQSGIQHLKAFVQNSKRHDIKLSWHLDDFENCWKII